MAWRDLVKENIGKGNERLKQVIRTRTGLSPAMFFAVVTIVTTTAAASIAIILSFISPPTHVDPDKAVQIGEISEEELKAYDGSDPKKPLLMAIKSQIYDVTQSRMFYGPGGPYALFAGRDASRALAKMSFEPEDLTSDISGLSLFELDALQDWEDKFMSKYVKVGTIKKPEVMSEVTADVSPSNAECAPESHGDAA